MKVQAVTKYVRISPLKVRALAKNLVGMSADSALQSLKWIPRKSARLMFKTLKSAVANAENNFNLSIDQLTLSEAIVNEGPVIKRFQAVARGSAHPIRKRTSHIKIVLTSKDEIEKDGKK
jgi:large subunit ribosomal protein L22